MTVMGITKTMMYKIILPYISGIILLISVLSILTLFLIDGKREYDNTDTATERSGMSLYTDNKTGCQYLTVLFGALTPRMNSTGKQICVKKGSIYE